MIAISAKAKQLARGAILLINSILFFPAALASGETCTLASHDAKDLRTAIESPLTCAGIEFHGQRSHLKGKLTPFWAQELVGADLAHEEMATMPGGLLETPVALEDSFIEFADLPKERVDPKLIARTSPEETKKLRSGYTHGSAVANVILRKAPMGVAYNAKLVDYAQTARAGGSETSNRLSGHKRFQVTRPKLVNISTDIGGSPNEEASYAKLSESMIFVVATGNDYSVELTSAQRKINGILVGNLSPLGVMQYGSRDGEEVTIAAPSSKMLLSIASKSTGSVIGEDGIHDFGGTSGAAPIVTGALANVISIIGDLRTQEAKTLLCKTAVPILQSRQKPSRNGCGMVNAYKLVKVADTLKKKGWPKNRDSLLKDEHLFNFAKEAKDKHEEARLLLKSQSCDHKKKALRLLRMAYLLQPSQGIADDLARVYSEAGLELNASFYQITGSEGPKIAERAIFDPSWTELELPRSDEVKITPEFEKSMLRALPAFGSDPSIDKILSKALNSDDAELWDTAMRAYIEKTQGPELGSRLTALYKSHPHLRQSLLYKGLEPHVSTRAFFCKEALERDDWSSYLSQVIKASDSKCDEMAANAINSLLPKLPDYERESVSSKLKYDAELWRTFFKKFPKAKAAFETTSR